MMERWNNGMTGFVLYRTVLKEEFSNYCKNKSCKPCTTSFFGIIHKNLSGCRENVQLVCIFLFVLNVNNIARTVTFFHPLIKLKLKTVLKLNV